MKTLLLLLTLTPFAAQAGTNIVCDSDGGRGPLTITFESEEGILAANSHVKISAQGDFLHVFENTVEQTGLNTEEKAVIKIQSFQPVGLEATIQLGMRKGPYKSLVASGEGVIDVTKTPPPVFSRPIANQYRLSNCSGTISP